MSQIQQFYAGQKIFITGGTGFLGKILTEKLLRSCPDIATIYLLIRAKKGKSPQERVDALFTDSVFDVLRNDYPDFSNKIVGVFGDLAEERLGLSDADHARLVDEVSVIFHMAATIRFNEKLERAVSINVNPTKTIVDIAKACKNLKVGVYVSTAYSHCVRNSIDEELYPPPLSYDGVNRLVRDAAESKRSEEELANFEKKVIGKWPNTYSFTKAIAEGVVAEYAKELPFAVFRPSIVMNAYREPIPGWLAGPMGLPGLLYAIGLGILHTFIVDEDLVTDIVPVDYVCNALISCAWETASTERRHDKEVPVYNYTSAKENPVTWRQFAVRTEKFGRLHPLNAAIYYPFVIRTKSRRLSAVLELFLHVIPALFLDGVARLFGKRPMLYKIARKIGDASRATAYFATQQWNFENERVQNLWRGIGPTDKIIFPFSMRNVDWDEHTMRMIKGLRKYLAGESVDNLEQARRRHFYLHVIHMMVCLGFVLLTLWIISKLFNGNGAIAGIENMSL